MSDTVLTDDETAAQEAIRTDSITPEVNEDAGAFTMRILAEGVDTLDGRYFTPGAVNWREPPISLLFMKENGANGHKGSVVGGTITKLWRDENEIWGSGHFSSGADGQELHALIKEGVLSGVSADVGGADIELEATDGKQKQKITTGTIMGVTVLPMQAFNEGKIVVTASAAPVEPPAEWFQNPNLTKPTPITVTDDGQVFGHLATWGTCHMGNKGSCLTPPRSSSGYSYFAHGAVKTEDGTQVRTGRITLGTGHAPLGFAASSTVEHYDNTGTAVADIAVGEDSNGIWFSGALRPDVTPEQVRTLRASAVSGDWRQIGRGLELVALLAVNTPGFPIPRTEANLVASLESDEEVPTSLVAANIVTAEEEMDVSEEVELTDDSDCGCGSTEFEAEVEEVEEDDVTELATESTPDNEREEMASAELLDLDARFLDARVAFACKKRKKK